MPDVLALHERLRLVCGDTTYAKLGRLTATHPETVRRYVAGDAPSAAFLAALCGATGMSADWLLCGRGRPLARGSAPAVIDADRDFAVIHAAISRWPAGTPRPREASHLVEMGA